MKEIESFYKTKTLRNNGVFILWCLLVLAILGFFFPNQASRLNTDQIYSISGLHTKYGDESELSDFLTSIKSNDGYLILGTSETTSLDEGNYYDFLNSDPDLKNTKFSVLAGAGRTCGKHSPWLLHHRDQLPELNLIYFINPVYWRTDLSQVNLDYCRRYMNYRMTASINLNEEEQNSLYEPIVRYQEKLNLFYKTVETIEFGIRSIRKKYFHNLYYTLYPVEYEEKFDHDFRSRFFEVENLTADTAWEANSFDGEFNIRKTFKQKNWFKPIDEEENFRYRELRSFIELCQTYGVNATFVLGPYNQKFIESYSPESLKAYEETAKKIQNLLNETGAEYVDATDISNQFGAFDDHQHHSGFGAYLIYQKLKQKIHE